MEFTIKAIDCGIDDTGFRDWVSRKDHDGLACTYYKAISTENVRSWHVVSGDMVALMMDDGQRWLVSGQEWYGKSGIPRSITARDFRSAPRPLSHDEHGYTALEYIACLLYSRDAIDQNRMPYRWHCTSVEHREKWREKARYAIKEWEEQDAK